MKRHFLFNHDAHTNAGGTTGTAVENQLKGQATAEQILTWKANHPGGIYAIETDNAVAYFKNPGRKEMNAAMSRASSDSALDMFELLAQLTFIGGSEDILKDDAEFFGLTQHLKTKMDGKKGKLVNL